MALTVVRKKNSLEPAKESHGGSTISPTSSRSNLRLLHHLTPSVAINVRLRCVFTVIILKRGTGILGLLRFFRFRRRFFLVFSLFFFIYFMCQSGFNGLLVEMKVT